MENENSNINKIFNDLVDFFQREERIVPEEKIVKGWRDVENRTETNRSRRRHRIIAVLSASVAAAVLICVVLFPFWQHGGKLAPCRDIYTFARESSLDTDKLVCIVPGCDTVRIGQHRANITCQPDGSISVNDIQISSAHSTPSDKDFCQLHVPAGDRAEIMLADGTRILANSNSHIIYPHSFAKKRREIYVSGEAYLEVARDEKRPFVVLTRDFNVKVLGTTFNVNAYETDSLASVALVSGNVELSSAVSGNVRLSSGEVAEINGGAIGKPVRADLSPYVGWTRNILAYQYESLVDVCNRLSEHYGREFVLSPEVADIKVSGKLYLKDDLDALLRAIMFVTSVQFEEKDGKIYVYKK